MSDDRVPTSEPTPVAPVRCLSSTAGTLALTRLFHWFRYSHWRHCWFKARSAPWVTFSIWSLHPHDGHWLLNNCRRRFSFTTYLPFICRSVALKINLWETWIDWKDDVNKHMMQNFKENLLFFDQINIYIVWFHLGICWYKCVCVSWAWNSFGTCTLNVRFINTQLILVTEDTTEWEVGRRITCFKLIILRSYFSGFQRLLQKVTEGTAGSYKQT